VAEAAKTAAVTMTTNNAAAAAMTERPQAPAPAITVRDLAKSYRSAGRGVVNALAPVNFTVADGEFVCLVGPSGCGKSTLLKILAGILKPSGGDYRIHREGGAVADCQIGLVFQSPVLLPWRTVLQNTMLPADALELDRNAMRARAMQLLDMVGLKGFESSYPSELSGGMQQRCSITRALLHDPPILLMDEPFGALDAMTRDVMNAELQRIRLESGKTIFLITHSISEAVFLADRILVMSARPGRIIDEVIPNLPDRAGLDVMATPQFGAAVHRIRKLLGIDVRDRPNVD
jgi:NitT/TauT family transport system ATP-binding protein